MSKNTFSKVPVSSALTVNRRHDASNASIAAGQTAMDRMLAAGLESGGSFRATVTVTGANVSATFNLQDEQRQGLRPHTARQAAKNDAAPAAHRPSVQPPMTPRPTTAAAGTSERQFRPPCSYFAAGFCRMGSNCPFRHILVQQAPPAPQSAQQARANPTAAPAPVKATKSQERPSSAGGAEARAAGGASLVADLRQMFTKPITVRPPVVVQPPRQMQCSICMTDGKSNEGVICPKGDHFMHRACLDQWITSCCSEYLSAGPSKPSTVACPHNSRKCCVFTPDQLRRGGGGASASCIALLNRVDEAEAALKRMPPAEQLRRANQDAYMCPRCQFGPIAHYACSNVSWEGNKCPKCSYHTGDISGWAKWNGNFQMTV